MLSNSSNMVNKHSISVSYVGGLINMYQYSSFKFSKLYLSDYIPGTSRFHHLQFTQAYMDMNTAIKNCVCLINNNGVFTVVGWYKRVITMIKVSLQQEMVIILETITTILKRMSKSMLEIFATTLFKSS